MQDGAGAGGVVVDDLAALGGVAAPGHADRHPDRGTAALADVVGLVAGRAAVAGDEHPRLGVPAGWVVERDDHAVAGGVEERTVRRADVVDGVVREAGLPGTAEVAMAG